MMQLTHQVDLTFQHVPLSKFWVLRMYNVKDFIKLGSREIHIAGITPNPNESWMKQIARNVTMAEWGFLSGCEYLIHDRIPSFANPSVAS